MEVYHIDRGGIGIFTVTQNKTTLEYAYTNEDGFITLIDEDGGNLISGESTADIDEIEARVRKAVQKAGGIPWGDPRNLMRGLLPSRRVIELPPCIPEERFGAMLDYIRYGGDEDEDEEVAEVG